MTESTIIEASIPNAGRIYDYLLGGHHNFEIDRRAGDQIKETMPFLPKLMRLMRWCLQDIGPVLTEERGFDAIIDFASGLPTVDHLHTSAKPGTTIIYSDRDPVCVEYGREILGDTPGVYYFQADCRQPEELLERAEVQKLLAGKRRVAFVYWGISMYLSDKEIAHIARVLYDWSDGDSCLAFYLQPGSTDSPAAVQALQMYRQMGEQLYFRPVEAFQELLQPWKADDLGYRTMEEWHGMRVEMNGQDRAFFPAGVSGYGVYLVK
jgi:hypothetical protein